MEGIEIISINGFVSVTIALLVYLIGAEVTRKSKVLRDFNIPEPVSGGLIAAFATMAVFVLWGKAIEFDLSARDYFLLVFFTGIGLNAKLADLRRGGKPLVILLFLAGIYVTLQNLVGVAGARMFDLPEEFSVLLGSASLIGGHGTVIAWTPKISDMTNGAAGVAELGVAVATLGLVSAALIGGPVAKFLIARDNLTPNQPDAVHTIGVGFGDDDRAITHLQLMRVLLWVHVTIAFGFALGEALVANGLELPNFVPCLLCGILVGNILPFFKRIEGVRQTPALSVFSDFSLGVFLAMSLMSLQLWALVGMFDVLLVVLAAQTALSVAFAIYVLYPAMGRNYFASVMSAGFGGLTLGATPTAIANMTAVTKRYGPSPLAFVVLPLVSAFFIDIVNSFAIQFFLNF